MLLKLFEILFGCSHKRITFPITSRSKKRTYVVCLSCGKEFDYSWKDMKISSSKVVLSSVTEVEDLG